MDRDTSLKGLKIDSTTTPHSLLLESWRNRKGSISCLIPLRQVRNSQPEITVNIKYKTENAGELYLKLVIFEECEKVKSVDTLHLPLSEDWTVSSQSIHVEYPMFLELFIEARGEALVNENAKIRIKELDIFVDGKNINKLTGASRRTKSPIKKPIKNKDVIPFNNKRLHDLPFMGKKILAVGETIHGTETFNNMAIDIIKERIIQQNCKLVFIEMPLEYSLFINRYIDEGPSFKLDDISAFFDDKLISRSFLSLIEWIKEFNRYSKKKVYFFGIDVWPIEMSRYLDLFNFFYTLNETTALSCKELLW